jgi:hypothetical protein
MGGTSHSTTTTTQQASPYAQAQPAIDGILSALNGQVGKAGLSPAASAALDQIAATAAAGNPYAGLIGSAATGLLQGGGSQANDGALRQGLAGYEAAMAPLTGDGPNAALKSQLDTLLADTSGAINGQFAAAGRDGSVANQQALARGYTQAAAPLLAQQYNTDLQRRMDAATGLYNAGNTTYGLLNGARAAANANAQAGAGLATSALDAQSWAPTLMLNAEQQRFAIPTGNYQTLLGAISPVAQAFGTQTGTSNTDNRMSGAQQFATIMNGLGQLWPRASIGFGK